MSVKCALVVAVLWLLAGCSGETVGPNRAPVAVAGLDLAVDIFRPARFDGSASYDPDGDEIGYRWDLVAVPEGGTAELSTPAGATTEFTPDAVGVWVVRLTVSDGSLDSEPDILQARASGKPCVSAQECDDGLHCNGEEMCVGGWCLTGSLDCSAVADQCNDAGCDEDEDVCIAVPRDDETQCDDGLWCTQNDACVGGVCTGDLRDCSAAAAECMAGVCNEMTRQCEGQPMADGDLCDDGQYCTVSSSCSDGRCQGGVPRDCSSAGGGCVDGICDEQQDACVGDLLAVGTPCDDELFCTVSDACDGLGNCTGTARDCSALTNQCNQGACDEDGDQCVANPINEGQGCDDGQYCNVNETCQTGSCTGGEARDCSGESDQCNYGVCNEDLDSCEPEPKSAGIPCDDGLFCTLTDACDESGICVGAGDTCTTECLTVCNDATDQCDPTSAGTPCTDDGQFCNGSEECDGSGVCDHTGDPCETGETCDEAGDICIGSVCSSDSHCPPEDLCRPQCTTDPFGCMTPPTSIDLKCEDPVKLSEANTSKCTIALSGGENTGQDACIGCTTKVGLITLDISDFGDDTGDCDLDGWRLLPGGLITVCTDKVDGCDPRGGPKDCCDDLDALCTQLNGNYVLKSDKATNCGNQKEEWRIDKAYDFSDLADIEVCFHVGDHKADEKQGVLVYAVKDSINRDQIFCQVGKVQPGVNDVLYPYCASLPAWAEDNAAVTILFIVHSENDGRIMYLDNISVRGRYKRCSVVSAEAFFEDFSGCSDPIADGWNGWEISSGDPETYPKCPGVQCSSLVSEHNGAEVDDDGMTLERTVDASSLDGNVVLCFNYGDDGAGGGSRFDVTFDAGNGWKTAWSQSGNPGPNQDCREVCINLSDIDSDANRNPSLGIRFKVDASGGKIDIYEIRVEGVLYCDGETIEVIEMDPVSEVGGGEYTFDIRDAPWEQFSVDVLCTWDSPPAGQEVETSDSVWYQP